MWKLLIADDEPKIRRGLSRILPWEQWNIEVVGEAENGLEALELVAQLKPDIIFVDINMPFVSGLEMIEQLGQLLERCIVIVITGHDEFTYAQKALKLKVFDYILKPVVKDKLEGVVLRAINSLENTRIQEQHHQWMDDQMKSNSMILRDKFLIRWLEGLADDEEVERNQSFFNLQLNAGIGMLLLKVLGHLDTGYTRREWDRELLEFATQNVVEDSLKAQSAIIFNDTKGHIVVVFRIEELAEWIELGEKVQNKLEAVLEKTVIYEQVLVEGEIHEIPVIYQSLKADLKKKGSLSPVVVLAKKYIDRNYCQSELSLSNVAEGVQVSPTYLSKQLKRELGSSFIDYLTEVRINKAIQLMNDPAIKVYEIAEMVGYSSQHYFSNTFKKVIGSSPIMYRKGPK